MAAKRRPQKTAPHVDLAKSDPVEAVEYVLMLLDFAAEGRKGRDANGAEAIREAIETVREVMKLPKKRA
jgi:hypothetical protein